MAIRSRWGRGRWVHVAGAALALLLLAAGTGHGPSPARVRAGLGPSAVIERSFESNGNVHVRPGAPHGAYFSNPPTSGWHYDAIPLPGIYRTPQPPEGLPHFMEHGGVWVLYTCPDPEGCPDVVADLRELVDAALADQLPVALAPYPPPGVAAPAYRINVVAWQHMLSMDKVDAVAIQAFITQYACAYTPEGTGPGCPEEVRGTFAPERDAGPEGFGAVP